MAWVRKIVILLIGIILLALLVFFFRSDPIGMIPGKALSGELMPKPTQWPTCEKNQTLAIEVRPEQPHSVTAWYFIYRNTLFVPASNPKEKRWPSYAVKNPKVKVKICGQLFAATATLKTSYPKTTLLNELTDKYPTYRGQDLKKMAASAGPDDLWVFEIRP